MEKSSFTSLLNFSLLLLLYIHVFHNFCFPIQIQAARETGALQAAKNKLEKQVEELTWRLQLEKRMRVSELLFWLENV